MQNIDESLSFQQKSTRDGVEITESTLTVVDSYRVKRVSDRSTGRGFGMIYDATGKAILVFSAKFPVEHITQLIVAWRTGHRLGLEQRDGVVS